jgi:hypothetical protein
MRELLLFIIPTSKANENDTIILISSIDIVMVDASRSFFIVV